jgi:F-type H+-transporting ATPase subunit b
MTIDWWTLGLQTVNVLVLVWLLGRFFWRPVAAMIDERRAVARKTLAEAQAKRAEAAAALGDIERTRSGFARERDAILAAAQEKAEQAHADRLRQAAQEAAAMEAAAKAAIAREREAAEEAWSAHASRLAVEIAQRLAARLDGSAVAAAFLEWLVKEIHGLPDTVRQAVAASGATLEAVSAAPLESADQRRCGKRIAEAFGADLPVVFKVDPDLIAGLELHGPHLVVANSWRADLTRILAEIAHGNRS